MPVAVAPDPRTVNEVRDRMREIAQRQAAAASLRDRQNAVAPMVLDEAPEPAKAVAETYPAIRAEWADAVLRGDMPNATAREIIRAVACRFGFTFADLAGPGRRRDIVHARWAAIHAVRQAKQISLPALGRLLGRDHTTILHGIRAMEAEGVPQPDGTRIPLAEAAAHHHRTLKAETEAGDGACATETSR